MSNEKLSNDALNPPLSKGAVSTRFSRSNYDKRRLPPLYFTQDYSVKNIHLFLKGEEYTPYMFNYQRMIDLMDEGVLSENEC
jgi:hypothetical protein